MFSTFVGLSGPVCCAIRKPKEHSGRRKPATHMSLLDFLLVRAGARARTHARNVVGKERVLQTTVGRTVGRFVSFFVC